MNAGQIYKAIPAIMLELEAIGKDKVNEQQRFKFRGIDDVYNKMNKLLAKHKVFTVPEVLEERTEERRSAADKALIYRVLRIRYKFFAEDGSFVESVVTGEGMDLGDKAANKAMSIAHKYALFQVFCIPTEDVVDPDKESHEVKPKAKQESPRPEQFKQPVATSSKPSRFAGLPGLGTPTKQ